MPELLIVFGLLLIVGAVLFLSRRGKDGAQEPPPSVESADAQSRASERVESSGAPAEAPSAPQPSPAGDGGAGPSAPTATAVAERPSLRERLSKSRRFLSDRLADAIHGAPDDDTWDDIEAVLIQADVGVDVAQQVTADLKDKSRERRVTGVEELRELLAEELVELFDTDLDRGLTLAAEKPTVWMIVGVNGTGKTTTIGKLANDLRERGRSVALAAADTFRAAADEQLSIWADRADAEVVKHQPGADPGAVAFDALRFTRARGMDVLLVDTAGRLHTKTPLMDELAKVRRVIEKEGTVHECLLVIDATAGQNGLAQAREFADATGVTGVVLAKLDGTAKGGIALAIEKTLGIPIKLVGVGESIDDLEPFDPKTFVDALVS